MTPILLAIALFAELLLVAGQVLIKRAMLLTNRAAVPRARFALLFSLAIAALTIYFFLWIGLMEHRELPLSTQYAFDAVAPVLLVLATMLFLREKLGLRAWLGIALIIAGLVVISLSSLPPQDAAGPASRALRNRNHPAGAVSSSASI